MDQDKTPKKQETRQEPLRKIPLEKPDFLGSKGKATKEERNKLNELFPDLLDFPE